MQKKLNPLIKQISLKYNIPMDIVRAIVRSQFECAKENTKKGESGEPDTFLNVRWKHLGLLVARPMQIKRIHHAKQSRSRNSS